MRLVKVPLTDKERRIYLRDGTSLTYRLNRSDIYTIHEVWIQEMYKLPVATTPTAIIDLGSNIGLAGLWLAKNYGCRTIIAVEPSEANARLARKNFANNRLAAQVVEAAAGAEDGFATFDEGPGATNGRIVETGDSALSQQQHRVKMVSMASLLAMLPAGTAADLIKMDIEGGEQNLLSGDSRWLSQVGAFIAEFHPRLINYPELVEILQGAGFAQLSKSAADSDGDNTLEFYQRRPIPAHASASTQA